MAPNRFRKVFSARKVVKTLKGSNGNSLKGGVFRKILVVVQFSLSIGLIICAIVVSKQIDFLKKKDLKFEEKNLLYIQVQGKMMNRYDIIKQELLNNPNIVNITRTSHNTPFEVRNNNGGFDWEGKDPSVNPLTSNMETDEDFIKTFKIRAEKISIHGLLWQ